MHFIKKAKEEGLPLRMTYRLMLTLSIGISMVLLGMAYQTIVSFHALSEATDRYILLDEAANDLLAASDYLTEEVQCYTVLGDRTHLDNYFDEAEHIRRRDRAVETMERELPATAALAELRNAMRESVSLMDREYYAMRLMLAAMGETNTPEAVRSVMLTEEDQRLTAAQKKSLAQRMVHDEEYYVQKNRIYAHLNECLEELKSGTQGTQSAMEEKMRLDLVRVAILIVAQAVVIVIMLWLTTSLGINPLLRAVDHIRHDRRLPVMGAHEFRYLADAYNRMYAAYKRSIETLSYKASHDELTGVYNRAGFDLIKESVDLSSTAFLLFDADKFKQINDTKGHEIGDLVLQKIAATLLHYFRKEDYICRIGGDEFVVLMVDVGPDVMPQIRDIVARINEDLQSGADGLPPISVSVGVSLLHTHGNARGMFREADIALYHMKDNGRRGCAFFDESMRKTA